MELGITGKTALVVAASKGMGKASALGLAAEGARVVMCARGEAALKDAVESQHARGGTVIVMDPHTGDILAMASYPWFDPNRFTEANPAAYRNRAVTDMFEPGSTNKVITAAAAIQEHAVGIDERLSVPWTMQVGEFTIHDAHVHGVMRMTLGDIIAQSSNIGAVEVADRVGAGNMAWYLSRFGLGHETGIGFPGEAAGLTLPSGFLESLLTHRIVTLDDAAFYDEAPNIRFVHGMLRECLERQAAEVPPVEGERVEEDPGHRRCSLDCV